MNESSYLDLFQKFIYVSIRSERATTFSDNKGLSSKPMSICGLHLQVLNSL